MTHFLPRTNSRKRQAGFTLVELMVAIVVGLLLVTGIATLIANQSANRSEVDRNGKMIENGRFALSTMGSDVQMAGYWGELSKLPAGPGALPEPCDVTLPVLEAAMPVSVQGYDSPGALPAGLTCVGATFKPGTDILVVRKADPDSSAVETAGNVDLAKLTPGEIYVQTGLDEGLKLEYRLAAAPNPPDPVQAGTTFNLKKKEVAGVKPVATLRRYVVHIYYISLCSVEVSANNCAGADDGDPIPTLKMVELKNGAFSKITIAEGIQNMQIRFGRDTDNNGAPDGEDLLASEIPAPNWVDVVSLKIYLLARSNEATPGYKDKKQYVLGKPDVPADLDGPANDSYKRHVFAQSVRLVNPGFRRTN